MLVPFSLPRFVSSVLSSIGPILPSIRVSSQCAKLFKSFFFRFFIMNKFCMVQTSQLTLLLLCLPNFLPVWLPDHLFAPQVMTDEFPTFVIFTQVFWSRYGHFYPFWFLLRLCWLKIIWKERNRRRLLKMTVIYPDLFIVSYFFFDPVRYLYFLPDWLVNFFPLSNFFFFPCWKSYLR